MSAGLAAALIALTALALALLLLPLRPGRRTAGSRDAYNLAVYRDQLAELERDVGRGVVSTDQAEAARAEIGRRILALAPDHPPPAGGGRLTALAVAAVLLLPLLAWGIYWRLGSPALPDQPFAARSIASPPAAATAPPIDLDEAVARLDAHLKERPDDLTGWLLLGRTELGRGDYSRAVEAYGRAVALSGNRADIMGDWGEAQVLAASGTVTAAAHAAFAAALPDPETAPRSRYYLALEKQQHGDAEGALQDWRDLAAQSPADAEWLPLVRTRIAEAVAALGRDPATPGKAGDETAQAGAEGPGEAAVAAAAKDVAAASPDERRAMIEAMVAKLAARLDSEPEDAAGWARLGRSYLVLHQPQRARDAYARAHRLKPDDLALTQDYAEAVVAAAGDDADGPPAEAAALFRDILAAEPGNREALWYVGLVEAAAGHDDAARQLWSRLLAGLPASAPQRAAVEGRLERLRPAAR